VSRALALILLAGCAHRPAPSSGGPALQVVEVDHPDAELPKVRGELVLGSWGRAPRAGERYALYGAKGAQATAEVVADYDGPECDHCPGHRVWARLRDGAAPADGWIAVGPLAPGAPAPRLLFRDPDPLKRYDECHPERWLRELSLDTDGDGEADLERWVAGASVRYELRQRQGGAWRVVQRYFLPAVLDARDRCEPGEPPDAGCCP
jgi:hypothetical protein